MMSKLSEKLKYMALGALIAIAGFMFGNLHSDTEAQSGFETIDKLTVRRLVVTERIVVENDRGDIQILVSADDSGGAIIVCNKDGKNSISLGFFSPTEPVVSVTGVGGAGSASLFISEKGNGTVIANDKYKEATVILTTLDGEGSVSTSDRNGTRRLLD